MNDELKEDTERANKMLQQGTNELRERIISEAENMMNRTGHNPVLFIGSVHLLALASDKKNEFTISKIGGHMQILGYTVKLANDPDFIGVGIEI